MPHFFTDLVEQAENLVLPEAQLPRNLGGENPARCKDLTILPNGETATQKRAGAMKSLGL
jgi:hypothetical protein